MRRRLIAGIHRVATCYTAKVLPWALRHWRCIGSTVLAEQRVLIVGGGHNGLVCACYLARAGLDVTVLEQRSVAGGAVHTEERLPGYRFDTCSVAHNMLNMTDIVQDLGLASHGLRYQEMDPFTISPQPDGRPPLRFFRSLDRTCQDLARQLPQADADHYYRFIRQAEPLIDLALPAIQGGGMGAAGRLLRATRGGLRSLRQRGPLGLASLLLSPYGRVLTESLDTEALCTPIAALAAHSTISPMALGGAFYVLWQAAYHRFGMWHAEGGSGNLAAALVRCLQAHGGTVRTQARVARVLFARGRAAGVELSGGERLAAEVVVTAVNPQTALLDLVGAEQLPAGMAAQVRALHRGNAVQFVVLAALDRLPPYAGAESGDWNGMQSLATSVEQIARAFAQAEAGEIPADPPLYAFTPSAMDATLVPPGKHTLYLACPAYPGRLSGGRSWDDVARGEGERLLRRLTEQAPGLAGAIGDFSVWNPLDMERELGLLGGHPMHLDLALDQLGPLRPIPGLRRREVLPGLFLTGAGTSPTGGVVGTPGRLTARAVLGRHG